MTAAVVTGAAGGLGSAVARLLAERGPVVLLDRDADAVHALAAELGAKAIVADVSDAEAVEAAAADAGECGVLINNAAVYARAPLDEHPLDLWDSILSVNLRGYFLCTRAFGRSMLARGRRRDRERDVDRGPRADARRGCLLREQGGDPRADTPDRARMGAARRTRERREPRLHEDGRCRSSTTPTPSSPSRAPERVPVRRVAEPDEVARVIAFLAGPDAGYVNGEELTVDGGLTQTLSETFPRPPQ